MNKEKNKRVKSDDESEELSENEDYEDEDAAEEDEEDDEDDDAGDDEDEDEEPAPVLSWGNIQTNATCETIFVQIIDMNGLELASIHVPVGTSMDLMRAHCID